MAVTGEQALRAKFLSSTGVSSVVAARIYPDEAPQESGILPYGILGRISGSHAHDLGADSASGFTHPRVQADWYAESYDTVMTLADEARLVADGFRGAVTVGSTSITLDLCILENEQTLTESPLPGKGKGVHRVSQDWMLGYLEATT